MFTSNPFADLAVFLHPLVMQVYIVVMILAVVFGTLIDMLHKGSAKFFLRQRARSKANATRQLGVGERLSLAIRTLLKEVITSGEFCNPMRRISHLFLFYGFITYLVTTIILVFIYPTPATPAPPIVPQLWNIGAMMVLVGGYWFFFLLRVDVAKEGNSPFRLVRADLFIVSLTASVTFALIWEFVQAGGNPAATKIVFVIYIFFTSLLFLSVFWSKFAHMFYKPAAAYQKRVEEANGSSSLPRPSNVNNIVR